MKKKWKKILISFFAILFILFTGYGLIVFALILSKRKSQPTEPVDTMVILGAQVRGTVANAYPSKSLQERLDTALAFLEEYPDITVIVSGGKGADEPITEAQAMADYLVEHGLDQEQIIQEDQSTNTYENLFFSNKLVSLDGAVVVTNDFHMYRSLLTGRRLDLDLQGLSAPTKNSSKYYSFLRETLALGYRIIAG